MAIIPVKTKQGQTKIIQSDTVDSAPLKRGVLSVQGIHAVDDIQEIEHISKTMSPQTIADPVDFKACSAEIFKQSGVRADANAQSRILQMIELQLKEVRKLFDTKVRLVTPISHGGAALSEQDADKIIRAYLDYKHPKHQSKMLSSQKRMEILEPSRPVPSILKIMPPSPLIVKKQDESGGVKTADVVKTSIKADTLVEHEPSVKKKVPVEPALMDISVDAEKASILAEKNKVQEKQSERIQAEPAVFVKRIDKEVPTSQARSLVKQKMFAEPALATIETESVKSKKQIEVGDNKNFVADIVLDKAAIAQSKHTKMLDVPAPKPNEGVDAVRPMVKDVQKFKASLVGPIDELRSLTLQDFRRLGPSANVMTQKILGKIDLLEEESYGKKLEGVLAWRNSEVMKIYIDIGKESLVKGLPLSKIIEQRKKDKQPYLEMGEINAIIELNNILRE